MRTLRRLLRYVLAQRGLAAATFSAHLVQLVLSLVLPLLLKNAIDNGLSRGDYGVIVLAALETLGLTGVRAVLWYSVTYNYQRLASNVSFTLRERLYEKIQRNGTPFHMKAHSGDLFALSSTDVQAIEEFLNAGVNQAINIIGLGIFLFIILINLNQRLTLIALPIVPVVAVIALIYSSLSRERSRRIQNLYGQVAATLQENLSGMRVVKAFAG